MRSRAAHLACLLLLLSSLAVLNARAVGETTARTPGGIFVRNMLLRAVVEESEPALSGFGREVSALTADGSTCLPSLVRDVPRLVTHTAHVHAVTGSSM